MKRQLFSYKTAYLIFFASLLLSLSTAPSMAVELVGTPVDIETGAELQTKATPSASTEEAMAINEPDSNDDNTYNKKFAQLREHSQHELARLQHEADRNSHFSVEILTPIVAIIMTIGGSLLLVVFLVRAYYRDKERRAQNINNTIDKLLAAGRDIPVELLRGIEPNGDDDNFGYQSNNQLMVRDENNLRQGIQQIGLGLGLLIFLTIMMGIKIGAVGFILIGLGISRLVVWKLSGTEPTRTKVQE
jgi:hypothetical protein